MQLQPKESINQICASQPIKTTKFEQSHDLVDFVLVMGNSKISEFNSIPSRLRLGIDGIEYNTVTAVIIKILKKVF